MNVPKRPIIARTAGRVGGGCHRRPASAIGRGREAGVGGREMQPADVPGFVAGTAAGAGFALEDEVSSLPRLKKQGPAG